MKRTLYFLLAICFAHIAFAQKIKVACLGNSITYGVGVNDRDKDSYPAQLRTLLGDGYELSAFGVSGSKVLRKSNLPYIKTDVFHQALQAKADVYLIHLGVNDTDPSCWPNYQDEFVRDYLDIIDSCRVANPKARIIVALTSYITYNHWRFNCGTRDWDHEVRRRIRQIAELGGAELIDFYSPTHPYVIYFPDNIHPNAEGCALLAKAAYQGITGNYGGLALPPYFQSHMVLPRNRNLTLRGTADAGEKVTLAIAGQKHSARANNRGEWQITLSPLKTGGPYELIAKTSKRTIHLTDILAGEVWLCSGQSNMEFSLNQCTTAKQDVPNAQYTDIRFLDFGGGRWPTWATEFTASALDSINHYNYLAEPEWQLCTPQTAARFSAVGYYFGQALRDSIQCPIGLIDNSVGGTGIEAWLDQTMVENEMPDLLQMGWTRNNYIQDWVRERASQNMGGSDKWKTQMHPYMQCYMHHASISKLCKYPIDGVVWYQGESNAHNADAYARMFSMLVRGWRNLWEQPELPFVYVQLSSLNRPSWPLFRDAQRRMLSLQPNLGMAVSSDLGDSTDVHYHNKKPLGQRLARWALNLKYGQKLCPSGPLFKSAKFEHGKAYVYFDHAEGLTTSDGGPLQTFEVADYEGLYYPAECRIEGDHVVAWSKRVRNPRYVRYAWQPFTRANLVNSSHLPASTFCSAQH